MGQNFFQKTRPGIAAAAFLFVIIAFVPISHAGGLGFAPLAAIAGIAGYLGFSGRFQLTALPGVLVALAVFLLWAAITSNWSPYDDTQTLPNYAKLLLAVPIYLGAFLLPPKPWIRAAFVAVAALALVLLTFDFHNEYALSKAFYPLGEGEHPQARVNSIYQNLCHAITVLALIGGPVVYYLARRHMSSKVLAALWVLAMLYIAYKARLSVGLLAMLASLGFMALALAIKEKVLDLLIFLSVISIIFAPLVGYAMRFVPGDTKSSISNSWEHRVEMWSYVAEKIAEKPLLGHGFDASRTFDKTYTGMKGVHGQAWEQSIVSLHPHNAGLHIWAETGAIGAALACIAILMLRLSLKNVTRLAPDMVIPMAGFLAAALTLCTFTYGIWQEWFWGILILIGALIPMSIMNAK